MNSFARAQLAKYGWKEGDGLGKDGSGRADPIKVRNKQDSEGVGHERHQFDFAWYENAFNKAASNIHIVAGQGEEGVVVKTKRSLTKADVLTTARPTEFIPSTKKPKLTFGAFVSASASAATDDDSDDDNFHRKDYSTRITDEELFEACGGVRVGQRGSFRQSGKLARLERHDAKPSKEATPEAEPVVDEDAAREDRREQKRKRRENETEEERSERKRKRRERKEQEREEQQEEQQAQEEAEEAETRPKKKKKSQE